MRPVQLIELDEVDRSQHELGEAAVAHRIGDDAPGEGIEALRALDHQRRFDVRLGNAAHGEHPGVLQLDQEGDLVFLGGLDLELQDDLVGVAAQLAHLDLDLELAVRLFVALHDGRGRTRTLEREVLDILGNATQAGALGGRARASNHAIGYA